MTSGRISLLVVFAGWAGCFCFNSCEVKAQVSLADDIIFAAKAKGEAEKQRKSSLGRILGSAESPYHRTPGSMDINVGDDTTRRASLPRLARLSTSASAFTVPAQEPGQFEQGLSPTIERMRIHGLLGRSNQPSSDIVDLYDAEGPPNGLTLDLAIDRLVHVNRDLQTKAMEIPQADADILTAGLRANPLVFYSSGDIPYSSYSPSRPGAVEHGISFVFPIDYTGKREARIALAEKEKLVLQAQYQDAVRAAIDELYTAYVDALAARQAVRAAEDSLRFIDEVLQAHAARTPRSESEQEQIDDLTIERDVTSMAVEDANEHYQKAKQRLGFLLELSPEEVDALELRGTIRVPIPEPPTLDALIDMARQRRPDLIAHRLGVERARAEWSQERSERFSDAFFLFTPMDYFDASQSRERSINTWGAGIFVSLPIFNRNQGNVRRAEINIMQSHNEAAVIEGRVIAEVRQASRDLQLSHSDVARLERVTLPAVRRKRDKALHRFQAGQIGPDGYLGVERETTDLVRFYRDSLTRNRRNMLKLNTAVGARLMP